MAKLKVFTWSDGFHAYTVATTSRAKALSAWGVARDLFKDGDATEITEGGDHDAALAEPGQIIRRGLSVDVGKVSPVAKVKAPDKAAALQVARLERDLDDLTAAHDAARADIDDRRSRLDEEAATIEQTFRETSETARKALAKARRGLPG